MRENAEYYHAVYIETDRHSVFYSNLQNNVSSPFDTAAYKEGMRSLKDAGVNLNKHLQLGIAGKWSPLYVFKGQFYAYYPSDGLYNNWAIISDSTFLLYARGDMVVSALVDVNAKSKNQYELHARAATMKEEKIIVHIIDQKNQVAVFEYPDRSEQKYELRVATDKLSSFPLIVNYCVEQKQREFEFDEPDFEKLVRQRK